MFAAVITTIPRAAAALPAALDAPIPIAFAWVLFVVSALACVGFFLMFVHAVQRDRAARRAIAADNERTWDEAEAQLRLGNRGRIISLEHARKPQPAARTMRDLPAVVDPTFRIVLDVSDRPKVSPPGKGDADQ